MNPLPDETGYREPPQAIIDLVDAAPTPEVAVDPTGKWMLVMERAPHLTIEELAKPELRLAGLRIDPAAYAPSRSVTWHTLHLVELASGRSRPVTGLPDGAPISMVEWAPTGEHFACVLRGEGGGTLWIGTASTASCARVAEVRLNAVLTHPTEWAGDGTWLLCVAVPDDQGDVPERTFAPRPVIQETDGKSAPARTYQDLLKDAYDEVLFEYYATSEVVRVHLDGRVEPLGVRGLIRRAEPSPNGEYVLVETVHKPFSYLVPFDRFPTRIEVVAHDGTPVKLLTERPLAEQIPIGFDAVVQGPRFYQWRGDVGAELWWVEAQDEGDPRIEVAVRDVLYSLAAPFTEVPRALIELEFRFGGAVAGNDHAMLVSERWWKTRRTRTWLVDPSRPQERPRLLFDRSFEDRYSDPGRPLTLPAGGRARRLLIEDEGPRIYLIGDGASPEGEQPFFDRFNLATGRAERLWQSQAPYYERPVRLLASGGKEILTRREAVDEPPNYYVRRLDEGSMRPVTQFPNPTPQLTRVHKELIRYRRDDGVELTATLYLPPDYSVDMGPLPLLMWAYPREYKSADAAGQVRESPYRFVRLTWGSPLYFLMAGYAVLDGPAMPIIGEGDQEANDTYVEQLTASARAAVDEVVRRGVADPDRIAIGGHSYGAFMTANLLAHSDLFCAGIARSGAFNRTLTPFGFQAEERTLWEAPDVYFTMSAFIHADKIKAPLLLIHGEADENSGTFPIQSERLYAALKGLGARARLVILPHEGHGYRARESILHTLWESLNWLDRFVKRQDDGSS